ncbi:hypothetical protein SAMN02910301_2241 [Lachnospiraceae bacterium XBD2001]|nr:hypothetical protein SAMN02910301_2241 [Lachnospiraceae bacterium XBD2001]
MVVPSGLKQFDTTTSTKNIKISKAKELWEKRTEHIFDDYDFEER